MKNCEKCQPKVKNFNVYIYIYYVEIDYDSNDQRSETVFITLL